MAEYNCLEDFLPDIKIEISDINDTVIKMILGMAQAKFCRDTRTLQQVTSLLIEEDKYVYACVPQWEGYNQTIDYVMTGKDEDYLNEITFSTQWTISDDRNSIELDEDYIKTSNIGYYMEIVSTVIPYKTTEIIDENIYELYGYILVILAKHLIYKMKNKPWSDSMEAESLLYEYNELLNTVSFDSVAGGTSGDQSINLDF